MLTHTTVALYLTRAQLAELHALDEDQIIELAAADGGIFVHRAGVATEEGSGVWLDALGVEVHGPRQRRAMFTAEQRHARAAFAASRDAVGTSTSGRG